MIVEADKTAVKAVFNTNVLVSGIVHAGRAKLLIDYVLDGKVTLILSRKIIAEFKKVISRDKFKLTKRDQTLLVNFLKRLALIVEAKTKFDVIKEDPADNAILSCCHDGEAEYLVSGDRHLLALREFRGVKIITVNEMLSLLRQERPEEE